MNNLITILKIVQQDAHHFLLQLSNGEEIIVHEDILVRYRLLTGKEIDSNLLLELGIEGEIHKGHTQALNYISYRPRAILEVRQYLIRKQITEERTNNIIDRLLDQGYLNDREFAQKWVANRQLLKPKGKYVLQSELKEKGIASDIIREVLSTIDQASQKEQALEIARKKLRQWSGKDWLEVRPKVMRFLSYKGYEMDIIHKVITKLESEFRDLA